MYFQTRKSKERESTKLKKNLFGLFLIFSFIEQKFRILKCFLHKNNKQNPANIKDKNIKIGIPIIFQHKYEILLYLNYPYKIYLSFSNSLKEILFQVKNSFSI